MQKGKLIKLFMATGKDSTFNIIIVCVAVALTGTFYYYDRQFSFSTDICVFITFAIFVVWLWFAFICGKEKRLSFIIFAYAYWLIPYVYILFYSYYKNVGRYVKWLAMTNRIASGMLKSPFYVLSFRLNVDPTAIAAVLLMSVMLFYVLGNLLAYFYDKNFVKVHEAVIGNSTDSAEIVHSRSSTEHDLKDLLFGSADNAETVIENEEKQKVSQEEEEYDEE